MKTITAMAAVTALITLSFLTLAGSNSYADSPGVIVGTTYYEYQNNGASGNRIVVDSQNGEHFCWMNGIGTWSGNRWVYYNFMDENGVLAFSEGTPVSVDQGAGYTNLDAFSDDIAGVTYHNANGLLMTFAVDAFRGYGMFAIKDPPDTYPGGTPPYWPYVTIDRQDRIHLSSAAHDAPRLVYYTRSEDRGDTWTNLEVVDTMNQVNTIPTSSSVSDKVAIIYSKKIPGSSTETIGDILYVESLDGVTWDFGQRYNVTNYREEDTLRAWLDFDAIYDYDDDLHIIWTALLWTDISENQAFLFHWSEAAGVTMIAGGNWNSIPGSANATLSKPSIGVDTNNRLFAVWTQFSMDDVSAGGWSNGELYAAASVDGGATWGEVVNITSTNTNGCAVGDCDSDHWSSMAELVDDNIHVLYINDKNAGAAVRGEGEETENPVRYLAYLATNLLPISVDDPVNNPAEYALSIENYPNPFNSSTNIKFYIDRKSDVNIEVFNLLGEKVATLVNASIDPGEYTVSWNASDQPSGIYFTKLSAGNNTTASRMILLK